MSDAINNPFAFRHEGEIMAAYWQMRNNGQFYIPQLGADIISIDEWKDREMKKLHG